jgi:hypothetical protein
MRSLDSLDSIHSLIASSRLKGLDDNGPVGAYVAIGPKRMFFGRCAGPGEWLRSAVGVLTFDQFPTAG